MHKMGRVDLYFLVLLTFTLFMRCTRGCWVVWKDHVIHKTHKPQSAVCADAWVLSADLCLILKVWTVRGQADRNPVEIKLQTQKWIRSAADCRLRLWVKKKQLNWKLVSFKTEAWKHLGLCEWKTVQSESCSELWGCGMFSSYTIKWAPGCRPTSQSHSLLIFEAFLSTKHDEFGLWQV